MMLLKSDQIQFRTLTTDKLINVPVNVLGSVDNFDLTQTRTQVLYKNETGLPGFPLGILFQITALENLTAVPQIRVGIAAGESDVLAAEPMTGISAVGDTWSNWVVISKAQNAAANDTVKVGITAGTADKLLANIYLFGFEA